MFPNLPELISSTAATPYLVDRILSNVEVFPPLWIWPRTVLLISLSLIICSKSYANLFAIPPNLIGSGLSSTIFCLQLLHRL